MCRLFGLTSGAVPTAATFWLLEAPDSLVAQSHRNPDGVGLGTFAADGTAVVEKQPLAAYDDLAFAAEARQRRSTAFVAHVRLTSGSAVAERNTHPFTQDGRIFAHNGVIRDLDVLEAHLGEDLALVQGETDSERLFALITREIRAAGGDVSAGITTALRWAAEHVGIASANLVLAEPGRLWALRWPAHHELWLLDRSGRSAEDGGAGGVLEHRSSQGTRVRSRELAVVPSVAVASEPLDGEDGWTLLPPGELLQVDERLNVTRTRILEVGPLGGNDADVDAVVTHDVSGHRRPDPTTPDPTSEEHP